MEENTSHRKRRYGFRLIWMMAVWGVFVFFAADAVFPKDDPADNERLVFFRELFHEAKEHAFAIEPDDQVFGDRGVAIHQIVLIYNDDCPACENAVEKLISVVLKHDKSVYLIVKHRKHIPEPLLKQLDLSRMPVVFIDGKFAEGWDFPGFLQPFVEDCGC